MSKEAPSKLLFPTLFNFAESRDLTAAVTFFENSKKIAVLLLPLGVLWNYVFRKTKHIMIQMAKFVCGLLKYFIF